MTPSVSTILRVLGLICFVFAMFNFNPMSVAMLPTGLALWIASTLP